ncbi:interleukin-1 receptor accessory protein [Clinocottus analis]|uniref:interleukin-1 receptor accessory protein n=1 Tax=Clinocottus analis TaxID=304258 RepID=UPI0035C23FD9
MESFIFLFPLLFLLVVVGGTPAAVSHSGDSSEPMCYDWGESSEEPVSVLEGETGWLSCPLFSHPSIYNYTSTQSGHSLVWYSLLQGQDLEQPVRYSRRISRDNEHLWLQPAAANDTGLYICMLSNSSFCIKMAVRLKVLRGDEVVRSSACEPPVAVPPPTVKVPFQSGVFLDCPDLQEARKMAAQETSVTWSYRCGLYPLKNNREQQGERLQIHVMKSPDQGLYFCRVQFRRSGRELHFTRSVNVSAVSPNSTSKLPTILYLTADPVKANTQVTLSCRALFPHLNSPHWFWWTVDGKTLDQLGDQHRFSNTCSLESDSYGDRIEDMELVIKDFQSEDLNREFNCSVRNAWGFESRRAELKEEEGSLPSVELGCGLGVTLVLMLVLFVVYHVFWLELLLLYRSWFGTDERHTDDKQYDVYISYARSSEEEHFVLFTLRSVLENELGFSVCIFDRDSLPGGNLSEAVLLCMQRSRRLLLVLSPASLAEKSFSLLECRLGLHLHRGRRAAVVVVVYRSVGALACVEAVQARQAAGAAVTWRGTRSEPRRSRFWLRLRLALPVRPLAMGRRMIDSTSSHSDLAALALQRVHRNQNQNQDQDQNQDQNQNDGAHQSRRNRRRAPPRGRARAKSRDGRSRKGAGRSGCAGFSGQVQHKGAGLTGETETQQVSRDRTEIRSDPVPETEPTTVQDSAHNPESTPEPEPDSAPSPPATR